MRTLCIVQNEPGEVIQVLQFAAIRELAVAELLQVLGRNGSKSRRTLPEGLPMSQWCVTADTESHILTFFDISPVVGLTHNFK